MGHRKLMWLLCGLLISGIFTSCVCPGRYEIKNGNKRIIFECVDNDRPVEDRTIDEITYDKF